jgi:AcrR family transcriptional regulator
MSDLVEDLSGGDDRDGELEPGEQRPAEPEVRPLEETLSAPQQQALVLIGEGKPIQAVAKEVGVNRGTIYRWMKSDAYFRAAYNAWQVEQWESCRAALLKCGQKAVAKILDVVDHDRDIAWKVVRELGLFKGSHQMQTDPRRVRQEIEIEELEEDARLEQRKPREILAMVEGKTLPDLQRPEPPEPARSKPGQTLWTDLSPEQQARVLRKRELERAGLNNC